MLKLIGKKIITNLLSKTVFILTCLGITVFLNLEGIFSDIGLEVKFYGDAQGEL